MTNETYECGKCTKCFGHIYTSESMSSNVMPHECLVNNEEEWWMDSKYLDPPDPEWGPDGWEVNIPKIVEEAMRRGEMKAWRKVVDLAKTFRKEPQPVGMGECAFCGAWYDECHCNPDAISITELVEAVEAKLTELKNGYIEKRVR